MGSRSDRSIGSRHRGRWVALAAAALLGLSASGCAVKVRAVGQPALVDGLVHIRGLDGQSRAMALPEGMGWVADLEGYTVEVEGRLRRGAIDVGVVRVTESPVGLGVWAGRVRRLEGRLAIEAVGLGLPFLLTGRLAEELEEEEGYPVVVDGAVVAPNTIQVMRWRPLEAPPEAAVSPYGRR